MNIIRSIQLEKSIKIKHYSRMEEKLNLKMEKLTKVGVRGVQGMAEEKYNFQNDQNWAKILCNYM